MDPWGSLARDLSLVKKLQVKWETLSKKVRWSGEYTSADKGAGYET